MAQKVGEGVLAAVDVLVSQMKGLADAVAPGLLVVLASQGHDIAGVRHCRGKRCLLQREALHQGVEAA